jgi:hypothetical protein
MWLGCFCQWITDLIVLYFFFYGSTALYGLGPPRFVEVPRSHTLDTRQSVGLLWTSDRPSQRPLPNNTQHSQETDIHTPGGIRTHDPSKRAAEDPRLRPHSHWDRPLHSTPLQINSHFIFNSCRHHSVCVFLLLLLRTCKLTRFC